MAAAPAAATLRRVPFSLPSSLFFCLSHRPPGLPFPSPSPLPPPLRLLLPPSPRLSSSSFATAASSQPPSLLDLSRDLSDPDGVEDEEEEEEEEEQASRPSEAVRASSPPAPKLSVREKKELASYAHSLGKKLKSQQVGKSGVTPAVAASFVETLEANELLKLKVHGSCPGELDDVIKQLEESTGSVAVGLIGRSVILYRPSLSKMKKKEARSAGNGRTMRSPKPATTSKLYKGKLIANVSASQRH